MLTTSVHTISDVCLGKCILGSVHHVFIGTVYCTLAEQGEGGKILGTAAELKVGSCSISLGSCRWVHVASVGSYSISPKVGSCSISLWRGKSYGAFQERADEQAPI